MIEPKRLKLLMLSVGFLGVTYGSEHHLSGQFRLRHLDYNVHEGRPDTVSASSMRARVQIDIEIDERRSFRLTPQATKVFGELSSVEGPDGTATPQRTSGDQFDSDLGFFEAYGSTSFGGADFALGRQQLAYGDGLVLGHRNWTLNGQAFDAVRGTIQTGKGELDVIFSKIQNTDTRKFSDDTTLYGAYYKALQEEKSILDVYIFKNNLPGKDSRDSLTSGLRFKKTLGRWTITNENIYQDFSETGEWAYSINLITKLERDWGEVFGRYTLASKDYDQLYANRHAHSGQIDILGRRNLQTMSIGALYNISEKFNIQAEAIHFQKADSTGPAYNLAATDALEGEISKKDIGNELDLLLNYRISKWERLQAGYMLFSQGDYFEKQKISKFGYLEYLSLF